VFVSHAAIDDFRAWFSLQFRGKPEHTAIIFGLLAARDLNVGLLMSRISPLLRNNRMTIGP